jgi:cytochrome c oxidase cbb3-type subunit 3
LRTSDLQAGSSTPDYAARNPYEGDANALAQGRRLYTNMNCAGCHGAEGGGAIGPPLADSDWIYGGQLENIVQSIMQGRPEGMPSFSPRLPEDEAWKIANYVVSLAKKSSGKVSSTTSAGDQ